MDADLPLELRRKYGLVHVPSRSRAERWCEAVTQGIETGLPPEAAGLQAARMVFPYEAREVYLPDAAPVRELIVRGSGDDLV